MKTRIRILAALCACAGLVATSAPANAAAQRSVTGLLTPESAVAGADGQIYVTEIGEFGKPGDGRVVRIDAKGKVTPFAQGLDDPKGIVAVGRDFYVADITRVVRVDRTGKVSVVAEAAAFPQPPLFLNDIAADADGNLYVSDSGDIANNGGKGAIFQVTPAGKVTLVVSQAQNAAFHTPNGVLSDRHGGLFALDMNSGRLLRIDLQTRAVTELADGFGGADGLALDRSGRNLYVSDWKGGRVWRLDLAHKGAKPQQYAQTFGAAADISLTRDGRYLLVPDMKAGTLFWLPNHP